MTALTLTASTLVDLSFPALGETIPRDHGYALYGAVSRVVPSAHGATWLGIHGLEGKLASGEYLDLRPRTSLRIRTPIERVPELLALVGAALDVAGHAIRLGAPTVHALIPAAMLDARLVAIRLTGGVKVPFDRAEFGKRFGIEARRQLERLGITGELALRGRRHIRIGSQRILGYAVTVNGLSPEHSLLLQTRGLGGKRRMGCGLFRAARLKIRGLAADAVGESRP